MNTDLVSTDAVAPTVWEHREMRQALASRDLKTVYERLQRVGVSQRRIARLTGQTASEVYEVLKGRRIMAHEVLVRIADGFGIPRGYMGVAYDESTEIALDLASATCSTHANEREEVRSLLSHAANVTMGTATDEVTRWWQPIDRQVAPAPTRVGTWDVAQIEALTAAMRVLDYRHGGGACRDAVAAQVRWAQQLLNAACDDQTRSRLHLALADLHNLAGWTSFDVGMYSVARKHFARAHEQAKHAADNSLAANVLYRMGRLHLHRGMHREALRFFQLGQITAQDSGSGLTVAMLCANEAWAYALLGDSQQMQRSISRARDEFARADHENAPVWVRFFGEADLYASIGVTLSALSKPREADLEEGIALLQTAVALRGSSMARSRIFELTTLAVMCLRIGERDGGLHAGRQAVANAKSVRSVRTIDRMEPLRSLAALQEGDLQDLANEISTMRGTP
ncbi:helix-turn-helix transcriptional regulator [Micromonospora polyrhachis]|uniref:Tetratricopeptide (TPR) repeat protein n=1 Tax=Micromonospora polyrhachis TaxID=1282883 RepID=A0A7W7SN12_9ACTN|nr:helix-turn-helix transcriptional regulator [Micromonospora polyrhachis]MBB4957763.1 tetratricopeptide (TPR) repeat protein [Micromonospora polyrhachis]